MRVCERPMPPYVAIDHTDSRSHKGPSCSVLVWDFGQASQVLGERHCVEPTHTIDFGSCVPNFGMH